MAISQTPHTKNQETGTTGPRLCTPLYLYTICFSPPLRLACIGGVRPNVLILFKGVGTPFSQQNASAGLATELAQRGRTTPHIIHVFLRMFRLLKSKVCSKRNKNTWRCLCCLLSQRGRLSRPGYFHYSLYNAKVPQFPL